MQNLKAHPFAEEFPMMSQADIDLMAENMGKEGFDKRYPIILYKKMILDGRNRHAAATKSGKKAVYEIFKGTDEEARELVRRANEDRRHLKDDWLTKRREMRLSSVAVAKSEGKSVREIATQEGVSAGQIQRDLQHLNGESKPAKKPSVKPYCHACSRLLRVGSPATRSCEDCRKLRGKDKPPPKKKVELKDKVGRIVPPACRDAYADQALPDIIAEVKEVADLLTPDAWMKRIAKITKHYPFLLVDKFANHTLAALEKVQLAITSLEAGIPYAVCLECKGEKEDGKQCKTCRSSGLLPKWRYEETK